jgi:hypothetical protein
MTFDVERDGSLPQPPVGTPPKAALPLKAEGSNGSERAIGATSRSCGLSSSLSIEEERRWRDYWRRIEHLGRIKEDVERMMQTPLPIPRPKPVDWVWRDCRP